MAFSFLNRNERTATLVAQRIANYCELTFSFLNRNERTATLLETWITNAYYALSVSSIGTNELQLLAIADHAHDNGNFQFPQSERTNCNAIVHVGSRDAAGLSVSSIGTNELQHQYSVGAQHPRFSFSFLNRNERTATRASLPVV